MDHIAVMLMRSPVAWTAIGVKALGLPEMKIEVEVEAIIGSVSD